MKAIIQKLSLDLISSEADVQGLRKYIDMKQHPGWAVHMALLIDMRNTILETMLSNNFTKLDPIEKDVKQRSYVQVCDVIEFLLNPLKGAERIGVIKRHNKAMEETVKKK